MSGLTDLTDIIIERRTQHLQRMLSELRGIATDADFEPLGIWKELMGVKSDATTPTELVQEVFERNAKTEFYTSIAERVDDPTNFEQLRKAGVFTETVYENSTLLGDLSKFSAAVDEHFATIAVPLQSFPWYFERFDSRSCVGTALVVGSLLYQHDPRQADEARFLEVYATKRRDTLINTLRKLENKEWDETIRTVGDDYYLTDYVLVEADTFHGLFQKDELQEMIADTILAMENKTHAVVKSGETCIDFPMEVENIKRSHEYGLKEGIFLSSYINLLTMLDDGKLVPQDAVGREFQKLYANDHFRKSLTLNLLGLREGNIGCWQEIRRQYGEDLPYSMQVLDYQLNGGSLDGLLGRMPPTIVRVGNFGEPYGLRGGATNDFEL